jgi:microcompartment protein CcmK/EutM
MLICRVVGDVVSTIKNEHLKGHKLLLVQPVDLDGQTPKGEALIALDKVDAGPQDLVLVNREGGAARILLDNPRIPVQAVIVGVIDNIDVAMMQAK